MKFYKVWAILAALVLIASCFMPWAFYPDRNESFTGFYSYLNHYGKPGKVFVFFGVLSFIFILIDRVWAKRINLVLAALNIAFLIKTYILFTRCYLDVCPEKRYGIYLLIFSSLLLMITALLPNTKVEESEEADELLTK